jgi:hypothetical protein
VHRIAQGECLASLAHRYGFSDPQAIFDHPDNAHLKDAKRSVYVLHPGDQVAIPDRGDKAIDCATGATHRFTVKLPKVFVRIKLQDGAGGVFADRPYKLTLGSTTYEGRTTGEGVVHQRVSPDATDGYLVVSLVEEEGVLGSWSTPVHVGHLDPVSELSGVQGRLGNLGFGDVHPTGSMDDATRRALAAFQRHAGIEVTGELDDDTRSALEREHAGV